MNILINLKVLSNFAYFRLINQIKLAKHRRQLTYQDPFFQWLKVLLLGVEKWRLKLEFFWVFSRNTFYVYFDIPICMFLGHFPTNHCSEAIRIIRKTTTTDYISDNVKFLRKFSISAILLASDEISEYFTVFVDFASFTTWTTSNRPNIRNNWHWRMLYSIWWKFHPKIIRHCENGCWKSEYFRGFF